MVRYMYDSVHLITLRQTSAADDDLLASVDAWFARGFDTADLKAAKALLSKLR